MEQGAINGCPIEQRIRKVCLVEVSAAQLCTSQIGAAEISAAERCFFKVRTAEVSIAKKSHV
jgi:hypothetical protein